MDLIDSVLVLVLCNCIKIYFITRIEFNVFIISHVRIWYVSRLI